MAEQTYRFMWGGAIPGEPFKAPTAAEAVRLFTDRVARRPLAGMGSRNVWERMQTLEAGQWIPLLG